MANITRKTIDNRIQILNAQGLKFNLNFNNGFYTLYDGDRILLDGSAKEVYLYLQGVTYGLSVECDGITDSDEYLGAEYLKDNVGKKIVIEAKKVAENSYYSQNKNRYTVKIERFKDNVLNFTAKVQLITPNGCVISKFVNIPMKAMKVRSTDSIDKIAETILKAIDMSVLKQARDLKNTNDFISSDYILWLTKDSMWYLGWTNQDMLTKSVSIQVL